MVAEPDTPRALMVIVVLLLTVKYPVNFLRLSAADDSKAKGIPLANGVNVPSSPVSPAPDNVPAATSIFMLPSLLYPVV